VAAVAVARGAAVRTEAWTLDSRPAEAAATYQARWTLGYVGSVV
jgi:hypothetical protein